MTVTVLHGDWVAKLAELRPLSVQTVVTSPPYWGLRDYDVEGQLGLERDPRDYLAKLVAGFRGVRRVLRNDGTLWINMGDSYTDGGRGGNPTESAHQKQATNRGSRRGPGPIRPFGLGPKQQLGMPWRLAFALQEDGWILRQDIIWAKPAPMPESVSDRCTKAHEYLFLFSKRARYYYDAKAIAEPAGANSHSRGSGVNKKAKIPAGWDTTVGGHRGLKGRYSSAERPQSRAQAKQNESWSAAVKDVVPTRNKRDVWTIASRGYAGAHFATFPEALVRPCILAGSADRACELCGAPWRPVYGEPVATDGRGSGNNQRKDRADYGGPAGTNRRQAHAVPWRPTVRAIIGHKRTCRCELAAGTARSIVLDCFGGTGTTAAVAEQLGRDGVLIELNPEYLTLIDARLSLPSGSDAA